MDYKYIEQLLERYWECETTPQEERILKAFFSQEQVPAQLQRYKSLFVYEQEQAQLHLGADFDERVLAAIGQAAIPCSRSRGNCYAAWQRCTTLVYLTA